MTEVDERLARALADLEEPQAHLLQPTRQTPAVRIYGSAVTHRLVPTPLALRLAALRGHAEWALVARRREVAIAEAATLHGLDPRADAARAAGRRRVVDEAVRAELQWRPWLWRRMPIEGLEHLEAARADRRGVILASAHVGPFLGVIHALAARGYKVYASGGHRLGEPGLDGRVGRWTVAQNRWVEDAGARWVRQPGSYPLLRALLSRGEIVWLAADAEGETPARMLGRDVRIARGSASLAYDADALVIPAFTLRRGYRQAGLLLEPLDPRAFASPDRLLERLAEAIGQVVGANADQAHREAVELLEGRSRYTRHRVSTSPHGL